MLSSASKSLRKTIFVAIGSVAVVAATFVAAAATEAVSEAPKLLVERDARPFADRFPNLVLRTHEGRNVRLYDDLLKGKIVLVNFMYATCKER